MEIKKNRLVVASPGRYVRSLTTGACGTALSMLPGDTAASFVETDAPADPDDDAIARAAYEACAEALIRERYTVGQELALLRQRDDKPREYAAYYDYCEECKSRARAEMSTLTDSDNATATHTP